MVKLMLNKVCAVFFIGFFLSSNHKKANKCFLCFFKSRLFMYDSIYDGIVSPILQHSIANYAHDLPHLQNYVIARQGIITGENGV